MARASDVGTTEEEEKVTAAGGSLNGAFRFRSRSISDSCFNGLLAIGEVSGPSMWTSIYYFLFFFTHVLSANLCRLHRLIVNRLNQLIGRVTINLYSQANRAVND